jgi:hypothetical protein
MTVHDPTTHAYDIGEEVVVRLHGVHTFEVQDSIIPVGALPSWTIAEITARHTREGLDWYTVTFRHDEKEWICTVPATAIEGTA